MIKKPSSEVHAEYEEAALAECQLNAWPDRTLISYQNKDHPNKFYPIRTRVPAGHDWEEVVKPENDWYIVVIEFIDGNCFPQRWAPFKVSAFRNSAWVPDRTMMCLATAYTTVARSYISVDGDRSSLIPAPSLSEWMQTRKRKVA